MMDTLFALWNGVTAVLGWQPLLVITAGIMVGILAGAMPGISPAMGVALLVPFTYAMPADTALILLVAIYAATNYGGSITAITLNTPGTPSSSVTALDGYPLMRQGRAGLAMGLSLVASTSGGLIGSLILIFFSIPLARVALGFHPAEYFALALFGLTTVASLGGRAPVKAAAAVLFGLLLNTIGIDPISGVSRFTFGLPDLYDGFALIPVLIGLFAVSEVFHQIDQGELTGPQTFPPALVWPRWREYWAYRFGILRASLIGTFIGIFPGAGSTIASFISYDVARRLSRTPERFGQGQPEGVVAAEAADSGSVGGALVPLLALGIPGSASTAVLIGAMMIHDLVPGPRLFETHAPLVYALFASLLVGNLVMLALGQWGSRLWVRVTYVPKRLLYPLILAVSVVGSFAARMTFFDVWTCLGFGALGWLMRRHGYPVAPVILGLVLGKIAETEFRRATIMGGYAVFFQRPVTLGILLLALLAVVLPLARHLRVRRTRR